MSDRSIAGQMQSRAFAAEELGDEDFRHLRSFPDALDLDPDNVALAHHRFVDVHRGPDASRYVLALVGRWSTDQLASTADFSIRGGECTAPTGAPVWLRSSLLN